MEVLFNAEMRVLGPSLVPHAEQHRFADSGRRAGGDGGMGTCGLVVAGGDGGRRACR